MKYSNKLKNLKISFSLRAFIAYFLILGSLSWYIVGNAIERLNDGMRQSAESVMVDIAHLIAIDIEQSIANRQSTFDTLNKSYLERISTLFELLKQRKINAQIYQVTKTLIDTDLYITDANGQVVFDSTGESNAADFSRWRDVRLTLEGEYGARTSFKDPLKTEDDDEKIMVIAAPVRHGGNIVGVVSIVKSIKSLEQHLQTESAQLQRYSLVLVLFAILISYFLSLWLTRSLDKISNYARTMAMGRQAQQPSFWDQRLETLAGSVTHLRNQLDGKEYVEKYIHSLTHELKTPITSIRGAAELLQEELPEQDRQKFINNIHRSNKRMAELVDKMLSLAKLESQTEELNWQVFDVNNLIARLIQERHAAVELKQLELSINSPKPGVVVGDRLLIRQAIANLLDNAIDFSSANGLLSISVEINDTSQGPFVIEVFNQGDPIPEFALEKLYERFFSLPRANQGSSKSTGLGLSFVQEIMKLHAGTVKVENRQQADSIDGVSARIQWRAPKNTDAS